MANRPGPHTSEGKAASSLNALKHGLTSLQPIVTDEDRPDCQALRDNLLDSLQPIGHLQDHTFQRIVNAAWNMQRCLKLEHMVMESIGGVDPLAHPEAAKQAALLERYYLRFEDSYCANLRELERLQRLQLAQDVHFGDENPVGALHDLQLYQRVAKRTRPAVPNYPDSEIPSNQQTAKRTPPVATQSAADLFENLQTQLNQQSAKRTPVPQPQTARNAPCPCGSGKKYKRCCGTDAPPVLYAA